MVAGTHVIGAVDDTEARRCLELAGSTGCRLLEVSFTGGTEVVVQGAQMLLSEEFRAQIQVGEESEGK